MLLPLLFIFSLLYPNLSYSAADSCALFVSEAPSLEEQRHNYAPAIRSVQETIDVLENLDVNVNKLPWVQTFRRYTPVLSENRILIKISLVGRNNAGKSTIVNAINRLIEGTPGIPDDYSQVGIQPGLTGRLVIVGNENLDPDVLEPYFGPVVSPTRSKIEESTRKNVPPVFAPSNTLPENLLVIDTAGIGTANASGLDVISNSEVIVLVFSKSDTGDDHLQQLIHNAIGEYGNRKIILVFKEYERELLKRPAIVESQFKILGKVFDPDFQMSQVGTKSSPIIATYLMPESEEVSSRETSPSLVPVGANTLEFPELISVLSQSANEIWQDVFGVVMNKIAIEARKTMADYVLEHLKVQLFSQFLDLTVMTEAANLDLHFPYKGEDRQEVFDIWNSVGPPTYGPSRNTGIMIAKPYKFITDRFRGRENQRLEADEDSSRKNSSTSVGKSKQDLVVGASITKIIEQLSNFKLELNEDSVNDDQEQNKLKTSINKILLQMINIIGDQDFPMRMSKDGVSHVDLKSLGILRGKSLDGAYQDALRINRIDHAATLASSMNVIMPPFKSPERRSLRADFIDYREGRGKVRNVIEDGLVHAHTVVPAGVAIAEVFAVRSNPGIMSLSLTNPLIYIGPIGSSWIVNWADGTFLDSFLKGLTQNWFDRNKKMIFSQYVNTIMLRNLRSAIDDQLKNSGVYQREAEEILEALDDYLVTNDDYAVQQFSIINNEE